MEALTDARLWLYCTHAAVLSRKPPEWQRFGPGFGVAGVMVDEFWAATPDRLRQVVAGMRAGVGDLPLWVGFTVHNKPAGRTLIDPDDAPAVELLLSRCRALAAEAQAQGVGRLIVETESFAVPAWPEHPRWEWLGGEVAKALAGLPLAVEDGLSRIKGGCLPFVRGLLAGQSDALFMSQSTYSGNVRPGPHAQEVQALLGCPVAPGIGYTDCELDNPEELILHLRRALGGKLAVKRTAWLYRAGCTGHAATSDPFRERENAPELIRAAYAAALEPAPKPQRQKRKQQRKRRR